MINPYAQTFMIATRLDLPRMHDVHPAPGEPATPRRHRWWTRRRG